MSGPENSNDTEGLQPQTVSPLDADRIDDLVGRAKAAVAAAGSVAELKQARTDHSGEKSPLALANREIGTLPGDQRKQAGKIIGQARGEVNKAFKLREEELSAAELEAALRAEREDVTASVEVAPRGAMHPITGMVDKISDIFTAMGWQVAEGPELEAEWLNFDALNINPDHPARSEQDTVYVDPLSDHLLLRTQTSPVQIRTMLTQQPPIHIVAPGKTFRNDEYDATHLPVFHQVEGLCIDKGITLGHLRGTVEHFGRQLFGNVEFRWRFNYFPFTEPSAEVDLRWPDSSELSGWVEWGGCGVVNPRVLRACGIDPDVHSGFAFGMGIERALMLRNGVSNMRDMAEGDVRFSHALVGGAR